LTRSLLDVAALTLHQVKALHQGHTTTRSKIERADSWHLAPEWRSSTADAPDANPAPGACGPVDGDGMGDRHEPAVRVHDVAEGPVVTDQNPGRHGRRSG